MFDKLVVETFFKNQRQLFPEDVVDSIDEAADFLEDMCAVVCTSEKEVLDYLEDGMDTTGMTKAELLSCEEVFKIPDGRFLIVEG